MDQIQSGLRVGASLDTRAYLLKKEVSKEQLELVSIDRDLFRGDWNYTVRSAQRER